MDLTPSPAVSSFIIYGGDAFPEWRDDLIVGSLKATELYRIVLVDGEWVYTEILIGGLARIRDVEAGPDGAIYLLLEHAAGGQIVKLVPVDRSV
jgi:glucose/arabinose dehydrogenase